MTTYNGGAYLTEQLNSIFAQTRLPDELIVCDDQSTDATRAILDEFAARGTVPMTVVVNDQRLGSNENFEKAIGLCTGDIIFLSDQDDVWRDNKVATIEREFERDPELGIVFTNGDLIDGAGLSLEGSMWQSFNFHRGLREMLGSAKRYDLLLSRHFVTGATMAFRSRFKSLFLPIPSGLPTYVHDRWIAVMISAVARIGFIDQALIAYRLHPKQQLGVGKGLILLQYLIPYNCSSDYAALTLMQERLQSSQTWTASRSFLEALDRRKRHIAARAALSPNVIGRLRGVVREYRSGRYRLYPLGRAYALKDLVVGTR
jgi:hypothetical protein